MHLLDHVSIAVADIDLARRFYDAVMTALGAEKVYDSENRLGYGERCSPANANATYLTVAADPATIAFSGRHWCFKAASRDIVDRFYAVGIAAGGKPDGAPGLRLAYHPGYYAAFLLDPDGNRIEVVCHCLPA